MKSIRLALTLYSTILSLIVITACLFCFPLRAQALTSGYYTYAISDDGATITDVDSSIFGDISIPAEIDGYPVISIRDYAFSSCTSVTSIEIPDSVISIGADAFSGCTSLSDIIIPDSVTSMGGYAFSGCTNLTNVVIGDGIKSIESGTFYYCSNLTSITIGDNVNIIDEYAFYYCSNLVDVYVTDPNTWCKICFVYDSFSNPMYYADNLHFIDKDGNELTSIALDGSVAEIPDSRFKKSNQITKISIPNSVTTIGAYAFDSCSSLEEIVFNNTSIKIGNYAFRNCTGLTEIAQDNNITSLGNGAFYNCTNLVSVTMGNSLITIGNSVFDGCTSLIDITIPDSVTDLGDNAFKGCTSLKSASIGNAVINIGNYVFSGCSALERITIGNNATMIGDYMFRDCTSLTNIIIPDSVISIGNYAFSNCSNLTDVCLGSALSTINYCAFQNCTRLTSITIPSSVTSIDNRSFYGCNNLVEISVNKDNANYCGDDRGVLFSKDKKNILIVPQAIKDSYVIPNGVTSIADYAFDGCMSLTTITIPNSVTDVGYSAFTGCSNLQYNVYEGVKYLGNNNNPYLYLRGPSSSSISSCTIHKDTRIVADRAFYKCSNLTSIRIPSSVIKIGQDAFYYCSNLSRVDISDIGSWCAINFEYYSANPLYYAETLYLNDILVTDLVIPDNVSAINDYAFRNCTNIISVTLSNSVTTIGDYAFQNCTGLTKVSTTNNLVSIGNSAFQGCSCLVDIIIPNSVNNIGNSVFNGCSSLNTIAIPYGISSIGGSMFSGCTNLTNITIPNSVTNIGASAFKRCSALTSITIPDCVTNIGGSAFYGCSSLQSIIIPDAVTSIADYTFSGCTNLADINIPSNVGSIGWYAFYNCSGLSDIVIPNGVESIGRNAFDGCTGLISLTIPDSITEMGMDAFSNCNIKKLIVSDGSKRAIVVCSSTLEEVILPDSVTSIGSEAFSGCTNLTRIVLGDGLTTIGSYAFYNCSNLPFIDLPDNITNIGDYAFYKCTGLTSIKFGDSVANIGSEAFAYCTNLTSITFGNGATAIGSYAFHNCSGLTTLTLPNSVTSIGYSAFNGCSNLESITIPFVGGSRTSDNYLYPLGYIFGESSYTGGIATKQYYGSTASSSTYYDTYYIPNSLKAVTVTDSNLPYGSFYNCTGITNITIRDSITSIGGAAFNNCTGLTSITIPNSVTSIGNYALNECSGLTEVIIGNGVTSIGKYAFADCTGLTDFIIPDSVLTIGSSAFVGCTGLTSITIPDSVTTIGSAVFEGCNNLKSITIPFIGGSRKTTSDTYQYPLGYIFGTTSYTGSVAVKQYYYGNSTSSATYSTYYFPADLKTVTVSGGNILYGAFYNCSNLTTVVLGNSVIAIGGSAFYGCGNLQSINIPKSVASIGSSAFYGCSDLQAVYIDDLQAWCNITFASSASNPLSYAKKLIINNNEISDLVIPDGITTINTYSFYGASYINSVRIPNSVVSIGSNAFYGCSNVRQVTIPENLNSIGYSAFYGCTNLANVYYRGAIEEKALIGISSGNQPLSDANWHYDICFGTTKHIYDSCYDTACNECSKTRNVTHIYEWIIDQNSTCGDVGIKHEECSLCGSKRNENTEIAATGNHMLSDENDLECDVCKQIFCHIIFMSDQSSVCIKTRVELGALYTIPTEIPTKDGYNFAGWAVTSKGAIMYEQSDSLTVGESITLYAQWNKLCATCGGDKKYDCCNCSGKGKVVTGSCSSCGGDGIIYTYDSRYGQYVQKLCGSCNASGNIYKTCSSCSGKGYISCSVCDENGEVIRKNVSAPNAPVLVSVNSTTVVLQSINNGEYSIDGVNWQESPMFENLESGKEYTFYQRYAKTDTTYTSPSSSTLTVLAHEHTFDNACDSLCNFCEHTRTVPDHVYDNACDTTCNECEQLRTITHIYDNDCDSKCNICGVVRSVPDHVYDGICDPDCNVCGVVRNVPDHTYDYEYDALCNECGYNRAPKSGKTGDCSWYLFDTTLVISGKGKMGDYTSSSSLPWGTSITEVIIEEGVTSIGSYAFYQCTGISAITIPDGVTAIGNRAFYYCSNLVHIVLPVSVTSIDAYAFYGCSSLKHTAYQGTAEQWLFISIGSSNTYLSNAVCYEANCYETANCINAGLYCSSCNEFIIKKKAEDGTHSYTGITDISCNSCDFIQSVTSISIYQRPDQLQYNAFVDALNVNGGILQVQYNDGALVKVEMTPDMVSGFDNTQIGQQILTVSCEGKTLTYNIEVILGTPDRLEITSLPNMVNYIAGDKFDVSGLTLKAVYPYGHEIALTVSDVAITSPDMQMPGVQAVTVSFKGMTTAFSVYIHSKTIWTVESALYPQSSHNYASNTNETKTLTVPGAESLTLTFSSDSYTESNYDFVYLYDGNGNQVGKYSGSLAGKVVTISGDTVSIKLTSDGSVNKYGYAFSSVVAEKIDHPAEVIAGREPTLSAPGLTSGTKCQICGVTLSDDCVEIPKLKGEVAKWNLTLTDDWKVNFYLDISDKIISTANIMVKIGDKNYAFAVANLTPNADGQYMVSLGVPAAQMNDAIYVQVTNGTDCGGTSNYTIRQYCDTILTDEEHSKYHQLVKEMLNYGAMAQIYFDYCADNLPNDGITGVAAEEVPETTDEVLISGSIDSINFYGASLVYRDKIAVRYYFTGDVTGCTFTANSKAYTPVAKDGMHYVEIADILPQNLDQQITLTAANSNGDILSVSYGPMNYIVRMNEKGSTHLQNLLKALYNYHLTAKKLDDADISDSDSDVSEPTEPSTGNGVQLGTPYKWAMDQTNMGATLYFAGKMNGYYGAATENIDEAVDVILEAADGGYYISFVNASGARKYINVVLTGTYNTHKDFTIADVPESVYTYSEEYNTLLTDLNGTTCFIGTHSTYTTFAVYSIDNINSYFPSYFVGVGGSVEPEEPEATEPTEPSTGNDYVKITSADQFVSGKYVMVVNTGYAPGVFDNNWLSAAQPTVSGNTVTNTDGAVWTLTVNGNSVVLTDANGVSIAPKGGANNGVTSKSYDWAWSFEDGKFVFAGTGSDTVYLASNATTTGQYPGNHRFRGFKITTVNASPETYIHQFTLYKLGGSYMGPDDTEPTVPTQPSGELVLKDGDQVVIYAPTYGKALSANKVSEGSYYNKGVDVTYTNGTLSGYGVAETWTVIDNGNGTYSFAYNGQNIGLGEQFSNMDLDAIYDKWEIISLDNGMYHIKNVARGNFMQWYDSRGNWCTYSNASDSQFEIGIYIIDVPSSEEPDVTVPSEPIESSDGYVKVTKVSQFTSGTYVMIVNTGYAPGVVDGTWLSAVQPIVDGNKVTDTAGGVWTLTVNGSYVTIADSNGMLIGPKGGNNNGLTTGTAYNWVWSFIDGKFTFAGTGSDTVYLASNATTTGQYPGNHRFRGFKITTVNASPETYIHQFVLYRLNEDIGE